MPPDEARRILDRIEATLEKFHGKDTLEHIRTNPIDFESMTEEEAEKKVKDPKFNDRVSTQMLLEAIQQYREPHKAEGGADQPATVPESKSEGKNNTNPESEVRPQ